MRSQRQRGYYKMKHSTLTSVTFALTVALASIAGERSVVVALGVEHVQRGVEGDL